MATRREPPVATDKDVMTWWSEVVWLERLLSLLEAVREAEERHDFRMMADQLKNWRFAEYPEVTLQLCVAEGIRRISISSDVDTVDLITFSYLVFLVGPSSLLLVVIPPSPCTPLGLSQYSRSDSSRH